MKTFEKHVFVCVCVSWILIRHAWPGIGVRVSVWVCVNAPTWPGTFFGGTLFLIWDSKVCVCVCVCVCLCFRALRENLSRDAAA